MSIYDRWHKSCPDPGEERCRQHKMVPSSVHGQGDRWQVRWRDENGKQCKRNFAKKEGKDPELHANAFDVKVSSSLDEGTYVDPATGNITFQEYAETWRAARTHDVTTGIGVEYNFRLHVYPSRETLGRTATGGPAIGHHKLRVLAKQPSLVQAWIAGMRLGDSTKLGVIGYVSSVLDAAVDDGLITRNPLHARSITRPVPDKHEAIPLTLDQVEALTEALRHTKDCPEDCDNCGADRYEVIPQLGAGTGMRQGEMFAIDAETDIDFLHRIIHVRRQVKIIRGKQVFAPIKNDKTHDVPLTELLCTLLARYMQMFPRDCNLNGVTPDKVGDTSD
jgi:integrase